VAARTATRQPTTRRRPGGRQNPAAGNPDSAGKSRFGRSTSTCDSTWVLADFALYVGRELRPAKP